MTDALTGAAVSSRNRGAETLVIPVDLPAYGSRVLQVTKSGGK